MIGIKIQNNFLEKNLLKLLNGQAEIWQQNKVYQTILTDIPTVQKENFPAEIPLVVLGVHLNFPFKLSELENLLAKTIKNYENKYFFWDSKHRQLQYKKNKKYIRLTEKESNIVDFLSSIPGHEATKEELLKSVWSYTTDTETHTIESTIHSLRQKLDQFADKFIISTPNGYKLT